MPEKSLCIDRLVTVRLGWRGVVLDGRLVISLGDPQL